MSCKLYNLRAAIRLCCLLDFFHKHKHALYSMQQRDEMHPSPWGPSSWWDSDMICVNILSLGATTRTRTAAARKLPCGRTVLQEYGWLKSTRPQPWCVWLSWPDLCWPGNQHARTIQPPPTCRVISPFILKEKQWHPKSVIVYYLCPSYRILNLIGMTESCRCFPWQSTSLHRFHDYPILLSYCKYIALPLTATTSPGHNSTKHAVKCQPSLSCCQINTLQRTSLSELSDRQHWSAAIQSCSCIITNVLLRHFWNGICRVCHLLHPPSHHSWQGIGISRLPLLSKYLKELQLYVSPTNQFPSRHQFHHL